MDIEQIQRSRLYRESFLPGGVTRLRNQAHALVIGARNDERGLENIDRIQLLDTVRQFMVEWESEGGAVDANLREAAHEGRVTLQSPLEVYVTPYPLTLCCQSCGALEFHERRNHDERLLNAVRRRVTTSRVTDRFSIRCKRPGCEGLMQQIPYVAVHRCGTMTPIHVPARLSRQDNLGFKDLGGAFHQNVIFDLERQEHLAKAHQESCPACRGEFGNTSETAKRGTPITSGEAFYPQFIQYIALGSKLGGLVSNLHKEVLASQGALHGMTTDIAEGLAAGLLGELDSVTLEREFRSLLEAEGEDAESTDQLRQKRATLLEERDKLEKVIVGGIDLSASLASILRQLEEVDAKISDSEGRFKRVRRLIADDGTLSTLVMQRRAFEAVFLRHDVQRLGITESIAHTTDPVTREARERDWSAIQRTYGIADIAHIPDLRVVLAALGYTRERREPTAETGVPAVRLNPFQDDHDPSLRGKVMVYAMSAQTEALWIRLDPIRLLAWCADNAGWEPPPEKALLSGQAAQAYLLEHCPALTVAPGEVSRLMGDRPRTEAAPFHLLHSVCHALLATARRHSGYDSQSLMEYVLPMDLSFVIYVTSVQNYTSGGLLTLFQHYLAPWFDDASLRAFNCAFDPICSDTGGACSGCIQTSLGCETFNHGLSRAYLYGGYVDGERSAWMPQGYWS